MCRHLGYVGPPVSVGEMLGAGTHSLVRQSWAPKEMRGGGTINADGFGVAWWSSGRWSRYRSAQPLWSDPAVPEVLADVASGSIVAAVRSATEGMPVERSATAPFVGDGWAFSHNGVVRGWPDTLAPLASELPVADLLRLESPTDSATLWQLLRHALGVQTPEAAVTALVTTVAREAPGSRLNLLLSGGDELWATAWDHALYARVDDTSALIASEPLDDSDGWQPVPDRHLVGARPGHLILTPLEMGDP